MTATTGAPASPAARITSPRNLVNVGVFTTLYFIALYGTGMLGIFHPVTMFVGWVLGMIINAIICMLYVAKTRAMGAYTLTGLVVGLLMVVTSHAWITPVSTVLLGFLADLVTRAGRYTNAVTNSLGYAVFSTWIVGPLLPITWGSNEYFDRVATSMDQEYADTLRNILTVPVIGIWALVVFVLAFATGFVGVKVLHKHFERAGVA